MVYVQYRTNHDDTVNIRNSSERQYRDSTTDIRKIYYDDIIEYLSKSLVIKTNIMEKKFYGNIIYCYEASTYKEGNGSELLQPDTFVFLLNKEGKVTEQRDVLFYNSDVKDFFEIKGRQVETPVSKDNAILGPLSLDDFNCNFGNDIGLDSSKINDLFMLRLDKIENSIKTIIISHSNYYLSKDELKNTNYLYLKNNIIGIKTNVNKNGWHQFDSFFEGDDTGDKMYVEDSFKLQKSIVCYTSAKLTRNGDGSWSYFPLREEYDDCEKLFRAYIDFEEND